VAAGIKRVVFVEPYPKSYAEQLHGDSIVIGLRHPASRLSAINIVDLEIGETVQPRKSLLANSACAIHVAKNSAA
jgi:hypothetical protein